MSWNCSTPLSGQDANKIRGDDKLIFDKHVNENKQVEKEQASVRQVLFEIGFCYFSFFHKEQDLLSTDHFFVVVKLPEQTIKNVAWTNTKQVLDIQDIPTKNVTRLPNSLSTFPTYRQTYQCDSKIYHVRTFIRRRSILVTFLFASF